MTGQTAQMFDDGPADDGGDLEDVEDFDGEEVVDERLDPGEGWPFEYDYEGPDGYGDLGPRFEDDVIAGDDDL